MTREATRRFLLAFLAVGLLASLLVVLILHSNRNNSTVRVENARSLVSSKPRTSDPLIELALTTLSNRGIRVQPNVKVEIQSDTKYDYIIFDPGLSNRVVGLDYDAKVVIERSTGRIKEVLDTRWLEQKK